MVKKPFNGVLTLLFFLVHLRLIFVAPELFSAKLLLACLLALYLLCHQKKALSLLLKQSAIVVALFCFYALISTLSKGALFTSGFSEFFSNYRFILLAIFWSLLLSAYLEPKQAESALYFFIRPVLGAKKAATIALILRLSLHFLEKAWRDYQQQEQALKLRKNRGYMRLRHLNQLIFNYFTNLTFYSEEQSSLLYLKGYNFYHYYNFKENWAFSLIFYGAICLIEFLIYILL